ncbi:MAG: metallophosphatase family protein [Gammaproteobacteria bacterium]|nr:metallophosphatase family protein [Gammaproteobacteria bacterium]
MIAIISDIHGNHVALTAVLDEIERVGVDKVICLGDIGGYYCQINECCETLQARNIFSLMGNHDWYLVTGNSCARSNSANDCLEYQRGIITSENLDWLASLSPQARLDNLNIVHGGWNDPLEEYVVPSVEYFSKFSGEFFLSGHTHVPCIWSGAGKTYCNPGSVGQPRDGDPRASFAIWDKMRFSLYRIAYDFKLVQKEMKVAGFDEYFYENLAIGSRIGGKIDTLDRRS